MILDDPRVFLHHVDFEERLAFFVKAGQGLIDARNVHHFDDIEPKYPFHLDTLLDDVSRRDFKPLHFLFMTDFCGSTLLLNALKKLTGVSCLNEVRAFAGLAIRKRLLDRNVVAWSTPAADLEDWRRVLRLVIFCMSRNVRGDTVVVKEWPPANYIISDILRCHEDIKAIFLYSDIEDYLNAVFRRFWRREFTRRRMVKDFVETDLWPMVHAGKESLSDGKIAAAHWFLQQQAFLRIDPAVLSRIRSLHNSELYNRPAETVAAVARHLGIDIRPGEAAEAVASVSNKHSKRSDMPYSMGDRQKDIDLISQTYRDEIAEALAQARLWLEAYPIPQPLPCRLEAI